MAKYYVYTTLADAQACVAKIDNRSTMLLKAMGRTVSNNGLVSKNAITGQDEPGAETTKTWFTPVVVDPWHWAVLYPDGFPDATRIIDNMGTTILTYITQDITETPVDPDPAWFPDPLAKLSKANI